MLITDFILLILFNIALVRANKCRFMADIRAKKCNFAMDTRAKNVTVSYLLVQKM